MTMIRSERIRVCQCELFIRGSFDVAVLFAIILSAIALRNSLALLNLRVFHNALLSYDILPFPLFQQMRLAWRRRRWSPWLFGSQS